MNIRYRELFTVRWAVALWSVVIGCWASGRVVISELMYHPPAEGAVEGADLEFLEIKNIGDSTVDLAGAFFEDGIDYVFPKGSLLEPGEYLVITSNQASLLVRYKGVSAFGEYQGQLDNGGERVRLVDASGSLLFELDYGDSSPWPVEADGGGKSLVLRSETKLPTAANDYTAWRASSLDLGTPGGPDYSAEIVEVLVNEVLSHTDEPLVDAVELYNPAEEAADIGGWYLSDEFENPKKYLIPLGTVIESGGYFVIDDSAFGTGATGFRLSSHGESVWLFSADGNGNLTGYSNGVEFGAAENGVSFGRYVLSTGEVVMIALESRSLGAANGNPLQGDVVFTEILYNPIESGIEYIELMNTSGFDVNLYDVENPGNAWSVRGINFDIPLGITLKAEQIVIISNVEPAVFRERYGPMKGVVVLGPFMGALDNSGERLTLARPDSPDIVDGQVFVPYIDVDSVGYNNKRPWPTFESKQSACIEKVDYALYGRDGENWLGSLSVDGSPGWVRGMSYSIWQRAWFSDEEFQMPGMADPESDMDGNGLPNLWEYATGGGAGVLLDLGGGDELKKLRFYRSLYANDVDWSLYATGDLLDADSWNKLSWDVLETRDFGDGQVLVTLSIGVEIEGSSSSFFRLKVRLAEL